MGPDGGGAAEGGRKRTVLGRTQGGEADENTRMVAKFPTELVAKIQVEEEVP